jgi:hypothetical protein
MKVYDRGGFDIQAPTCTCDIRRSPGEPHQDSFLVCFSLKTTFSLSSLHVHVPNFTFFLFLILFFFPLFSVLVLDDC